MPAQEIKIKLNGQEVVCQEGETVMAAAARQGLEIPSLCEHGDFPHKANCRVCVVELVTGSGKNQSSKLITSCSTKVSDGMVILTNSDKVKRSRNLNLELIFAEHVEKCPTCVWRFECKLLEYADKYHIRLNTFKDRKTSRKTYKFANAVELDGSQCIDCKNCVDACSLLQGINYLEVHGKGHDQEIRPTTKNGVECILCGQCAVHCPVSAAQEQHDYPEVERLMSEGKKIMVAQFAPSIRVSIGEDFGLGHGEIVTGQLVAALRQLGFKYVFDVNFAADVTTMVEAEELIARIKNKGKMPMITSCCPAWVRYVEYYRPDLIPNITTSRSPQIHGGGLIKTYWAQLAKVNPKDIVVVSIMPCTAKKYEASRSEMFLAGDMRPVDHVLTTRELSYLLKKNGINLGKLESEEADAPLGEYTGAAAIYGGSGGVMESALRTAQAVLCGPDSPLAKKRLDFKEVRGLDGIKETTVDFGQAGKLRVAVANGMANVQEALKKIDQYDYIEMMACPGGCIGGGGEPLPTNPAVRQARMEALIKLDKQKKIREAHKNQSVKTALAWLKEQGHETEHRILHTKYFKRK